MKFFFGAFLLSVSIQVSAKEISEGFTSRNLYESGTAVWNQATGKIHPSMVVRDWDNGNGPESSEFVLGDGSDGSFERSTYSKFAISVDTIGKIIYFNNDTYQKLQVTSFYLEDGWILRPVFDKPLEIFVLGDALIEGVIDCAGRPGNDGVGTIPGTGGEGRCGGGNGGAGGAVFTSDNGTSGPEDGKNGISPDLNISGGPGGQISGGTNGAGGAGGGGFRESIDFPNDSAGDGGGANTVPGSNAGLNFPDPTFVHLAGGAGGGGGSGSSTQAGAGGGGGGGAITLTVKGNLTFGVNSQILAHGGKGGVTTNNAGEGGGGGGGSVKTWAGGKIEALPGGLFIDGRGGVESSANAGRRGSGGWNGRTWTVAGPAGFQTVSATMSPNEDLTMVQFGIVYSTKVPDQAPEYVITKMIDVDSTLASFGSLRFSPSSSEVNVQIAGSNDRFVDDDSGWIDMADVSQLNHKRYVRFKIEIANTDDQSPTEVDSLTLEYTAGTQKEFGFESSGCGIVAGPGAGSPPPWMGLFLLMPLVFWNVLRFRIRSR